MNIVDDSGQKEKQVYRCGNYYRVTTWIEGPNYLLIFKAPFQVF